MPQPMAIGSITGMLRTVSIPNCEANIGRPYQEIIVVLANHAAHQAQRFDFDFAMSGLSLSLHFNHRMIVDARIPRPLLKERLEGCKKVQILSLVISPLHRLIRASLWKLRGVQLQQP